MPAKRANPSSSSKETSRPAKKTKTAPTKTKPRTPKLQLSTPPNWKDLHPEWSENKPKGKNAKKCIERWCLLPPYDLKITEKQWKAYYEERFEMDKINTCGSSSSEIINSEDIGSPWWSLQTSAGKLAAAIYGSVLDHDRKVSIARTLRGSLYMTGYEGEHDGSSPRTVDARTRLYSPFGIGTSVDFAYYYHFRYREGEQYASLVAYSNDITSSDPDKPSKCKAQKSYTKAQPGSVSIFDWSGSKKIKATTVDRIQSFEPTLFGSSGWLSPLKLHTILCAASTATTHEDDNYSTDPIAGSSTKFSLFEGETTGEDLSQEESERLKKLDEEWELEPLEEGEEEAYVDEDIDTPGCLPKRMLLLARQDWDQTK